MSALGHKQTFRAARAVSALPLKTAAADHIVKPIVIDPRLVFFVIIPGEKSPEKGNSFSAATIGCCPHPARWAGIETVERLFRVFPCPARASSKGARLHKIHWYRACARSGSNSSAT